MTAQEIVLPRVKLVRKEIILPLAAMAMPFVLAGPQWLVGTIVNSILFISAVKLERKYRWPIVMMPSLAVAARGVIFGPFTWLLIYFMPVIWLGNYVLMEIFYRFARLPRPRLPLGLAMTASSAAKATLLFLAANVYFRLGIVPRIFLSTMGIVQLMTAMAGGMLGLFIIKMIYTSKT